EVEGRQEGSRYRLSFGRPLEVALDPAVARQGAYHESAHLGPDERELALELAPHIVVRQAVENGRIVVLDLAPDAAVRQAIRDGRVVVSDLPPAVAAEQVKVRAGLHEGFARIVFEWSVPTTFEAVAAARRVDIRFSRGGDIDTAALAPRLAPWLEEASASRSDGRSNVRLEPQPGVSARVFQVDDRRIAVDLRRQVTQPAQQEAAVQARTSPAPSVESGATRSAQPVAPEPAPPVAPAAARPGMASASVPPWPATGNVQLSDPTLPADRLDDELSLDFTWTKPVAAAVFVRAAHLWVVFAAEANRPEDLAMPAELPDDLGQGERIAASGGTALRFALRRPVTAAARRDDRTWRVRLSVDAQAPRPLYPLRLASPARLRLAPGEPARLVLVRDPDTGEQLTVWPLLQTDLGQPRQSLVQIELLATAQGLAWRLRSDRVQPRVIGDAVEFEAPGGLALSERPGRESSAAVTGAANPTPTDAVGAGARGPAVQMEPPGPSAAAAAPAHTPAAEAELSGESAAAGRSVHTPGRQTELPGASAVAAAPPPKPVGATGSAPEPSLLEHRAGAAAEPAGPLGLVGWELRSGDT
ncbi:MAG TPA: hypothetical protein VH741_07255, partial [Candidatus Limnocylindrales bacterium]